MSGDLDHVHMPTATANQSAIAENIAPQPEQPQSADPSRETQIVEAEPNNLPNFGPADPIANQSLPNRLAIDCFLGRNTVERSDCTQNAHQTAVRYNEVQYVCRDKRRHSKRRSKFHQTVISLQQRNGSSRSASQTEQCLTTQMKRQADSFKQTQTTRKATS